MDDPMAIGARGVHLSYKDTAINGQQGPKARITFALVGLEKTRRQVFTYRHPATADGDDDGAASAADAGKAMFDFIPEHRGGIMRVTHGVRFEGKKKERKTYLVDIDPPVVLDNGTQLMTSLWEDAQYAKYWTPGASLYITNLRFTQADDGRLHTNVASIEPYQSPVRLNDMPLCSRLRCLFPPSGRVFDILDRIDEPDDERVSLGRCGLISVNDGVFTEDDEDEPPPSGTEAVPRTGGDHAGWSTREDDYIYGQTAKLPGFALDLDVLQWSTPTTGDPFLRDQDGTSLGLDESKAKRYLIQTRIWSDQCYGLGMYDPELFKKIMPHHPIPFVLLMKPQMEKTDAGPYTNKTKMLSINTTAQHQREGTCRDGVIAATTLLVGWRIREYLEKSGKGIRVSIDYIKSKMPARGRPREYRANLLNDNEKTEGVLMLNEYAAGLDALPPGQWRFYALVGADCAGLTAETCQEPEKGEAYLKEIRMKVDLAFYAVRELPPPPVQIVTTPPPPTTVPEPDVLPPPPSAPASVPAPPIPLPPPPPSPSQSQPPLEDSSAAEHDSRTTPQHQKRPLDGDPGTRSVDATMVEPVRKKVKRSTGPKGSRTSSHG
jgi:hypothetical protein